MKKTFILFMLLLQSTFCYASPPARDNVYVPGEIISADDVMANENLLFNYLQAGVDTFSDGTIVNADINSSANIQSDKLNLTSIAQAMLINSSGSLEVDGAANFDGAVDFDGTVTFAGTTIADLGTVTTGIVSGVSILSGSLNGSIGNVTRNPGRFTTLSATGETNLAGTLKVGSTNQGDVLYDNGSSIVRLTPGTSGYFLKTQGAGANPTWAENTQYFQLVSTTSGTTGSGDSTDSVAISASSTYWVEFEIEDQSTNPNTIFLTFNDDGGANYSYARSELNFNTTESETHEADDAHTSISFGAMGTDAQEGIIRGGFYIDTTAYESLYTAFLWGQYIKHDATELTRAEIAGTYNTAPTSFEFDSANSIFGYTIRLYKLSH